MKIKLICGCETIDGYYVTTEAYIDRENNGAWESITLDGLLELDRLFKWEEKSRWRDDRGLNIILREKVERTEPLDKELVWILNKKLAEAR